MSKEKSRPRSLFSNRLRMLRLSLIHIYLVWIAWRGKPNRVPARIGGMQRHHAGPGI